MLVAISFMDIVTYQSSGDFERNEAIYVLHTIDEKSLDAISAEFKLAIEEVQKIIAVHKKYQMLLLGTTE
jgi:hypothetical protein